MWPQGVAGWDSDDEEDMEATKMDQNMDLWQTRREEAAAEAAAAAGAAADPGAAEAGAGPLSADAADPSVADTSDERKHKLEAQAARANDGLDMFAEQVIKGSSPRHNATTYSCLQHVRTAAICHLCLCGYEGWTW